MLLILCASGCMASDGAVGVASGALQAGAPSPTRGVLRPAVSLTALTDAAAMNLDICAVDGGDVVCVPGGFLFGAVPELFGPYFEGLTRASDGLLPSEPTLIGCGTEGHLFFGMPAGGALPTATALDGWNGSCTPSSRSWPQTAFRDVTAPALPSGSTLTPPQVDAARAFVGSLLSECTLGWEGLVSTGGDDDDDGGGDSSGSSTGPGDSGESTDVDGDALLVSMAKLLAQFVTWAFQDRNADGTSNGRELFEYFQAANALYEEWQSVSGADSITVSVPDADGTVHQYSVKKGTFIHTPQGVIGVDAHGNVTISHRPSGYTHPDLEPGAPSCAQRNAALALILQHCDEADWNTPECQLLARWANGCGADPTVATPTPDDLSLVCPERSSDVIAVECELRALVVDCTDEGCWCEPPWIPLDGSIPGLSPDICSDPRARPVDGDCIPDLGGGGPGGGPPVPAGPRPYR